MSHVTKKKVTVTLAILQSVYNSIVSVTSKEDLVGLVTVKPYLEPSQAFIWYDNDKELKTCFSVPQVTGDGEVGQY